MTGQRGSTPPARETGARPGTRPVPGAPPEIAPGLHLLTAGRGVLSANVYFARSGGSWVLIDAAWPHQEGRILAAAEALFGPAARPAAILLTHIHPDHTGSALALARHWRVAVYAHPAELPMAPGRYLPEYANPLDRWLVGPLMSLLPARTRRRIEASGSLADVIRPLPDGPGLPGLPDWEYVPTPGHTPGHVAYFRPAGRVLVTGDAVLTIDLNSLAGLLRRGPTVAGPPRITSWDWPAARASVTRLAGLEPRVLAPGHGEPVTGPAAAAALRRFAARLAGQPGWVRNVRAAGARRRAAAGRRPAPAAKEAGG